MKDLSNILLEKLKINKDTKILPPIFSKGEYMFVMSLKLWGKELEFRIYHPFECINFNQNKIKYKTSAGKEIEQEIFLNSNNYYEVKIKKNDYIGVFLKIDDGLNLLEKYNDRKFTRKTELPKYFDSSDKEIIEKNDINPYFNIDVDIPNFIKEYKIKKREL